jgi:primosomal protein N' (replication factor Y)
MTTRYADIALNPTDSTGIRHPLTYQLPAEWGDQLEIGMLVEVPFKTAVTTGIVVGFTDTSPVTTPKSIHAVIDPIPVVTPEQIEVARWLADHVLCSVGACLWLSLPPGLARTGDLVYWLNPDFTEKPDLVSDNTYYQEQLIITNEVAERTPRFIAEKVVALLEERGALRGAQLDYALRGKQWRYAIRSHLERGQILSEAKINDPTARAKVVPTVQLSISVDAAIPQRDKLKANSKRRKVLDILIQQPEKIFLASELIQAAGADSGTLSRLAKAAIIQFGTQETWRDPLAGREFVSVTPPELTPGQAEAWQTLSAAIHSGAYHPFLLHGVTGSGKTELYLRAIGVSRSLGRTAIALVPEIALIPQTIRRFMARFPDRVALIHSQLTPGQEYDTWRRIRNGEVDLVIGARSALFAPLPRIGVIILDEEHDGSYKQSPPVPPPYYHARDVALKMGQIHQATVILGSATPDLVTMFRAKRDAIRLITLPDRVMVHRARLEEQREHLNVPADRYQPEAATDGLSAPLPPVEVIDMREELKAGNRSMFSRALSKSLAEVLNADQQAILYLNRRGSASMVMCRDCGYTALCPRCETPLTFHESESLLTCHTCSHRVPQPTDCPNCNSSRIRYFSAGTAELEKILKQEFPQARPGRWDRDTTRARGAHEAILEQFRSGETNVLVGTQMIAKGLDVPRVTLVGVVSADTALGLPDYRASERAFQLLTQVAGRAGRSWLGGRVILQTYQPDHYAIRAAANHDFFAFYDREIHHRRELGYPPFRRVARILFRDDREEQAQSAAEKTAEKLKESIRQRQLTATRLIGPAPCFFKKNQDIYRWQLIVQSSDPAAALESLKQVGGMFIDIDPLDIL